jgi:hypothetical protein
MKNNKIYFHIHQDYEGDIISPFCPNSYKLKELIGTKVFSNNQIHKILDLGFKITFIVNKGTLYEKMFNAFCWTLDGTIKYEQPSYSNEKITILMNDAKTNEGALQPHIRELKDHLAKLKYGEYKEVN